MKKVNCLNRCHRIYWYSDTIYTCKRHASISDTKTHHTFSQHKLVRGENAEMRSLSLQNDIVQKLQIDLWGYERRDEASRIFLELLFRCRRCSQISCPLREFETTTMFKGILVCSLSAKRRVITKDQSGEITRDGHTKPEWTPTRKHTRLHKPSK